MHGFPYDPRAFDGVVPPLVAGRTSGDRALSARATGRRRFLDAGTPRSGQQAVDRPRPRGTDGRAGAAAGGARRFSTGAGAAACVAAALCPERVRGLVSANGYNIQDIAGCGHAGARRRSTGLWYQYYFQHRTRAAPGCRPTARIVASSCGSYGRRTGSSTTQPIPHGRSRSTTRISSTRRHSLLPPPLRLCAGRPKPTTSSSASFPSGPHAHHGARPSCCHGRRRRQSRRPAPRPRKRASSPTLPAPAHPGHRPRCAGRKPRRKPQRRCWNLRRRVAGGGIGRGEGV